MKVDMQSLDFFDPATLSEPFAAFDVARQHAPVYKVPGQDMTFVLSYDLVKEALMQPLLFSSKNDEAILGTSIHVPECAEIYKKGWPQLPTLLTNDPPEHTRFRKLVNRAFTAPRVDQMEEHIVGVVDGIIDSFIDDGQIDYVKQFAVPLPCSIIAQQLGIDEADIPKVKAWSDAFIELIGSDLSVEEQVARANMVVEFQHYMMERLLERKKNPRDDMLTALVQATADDESPLSDAEILCVAQQILVAGNATTTHMLAGGLLTLMQNPDQMAKVRADESLIPALVEELVRLQSPTKGMWRKAVEDTELNGVAIPKDSMLLLMFSAANRDPKYFPNPNALDVERKYEVPHLAFSRGVHTCIGMMLSRKEQVCAFRQVLRRMDNIRLAEGAETPGYISSLMFRGLESLPIQFDKKVGASAA
ncbi:MAG: cytochrome P450 [Halioglobus sp.]